MGFCNMSLEHTDPQRFSQRGATIDRPRYLRCGGSFLLSNFFPLPLVLWYPWHLSYSLDFAPQQKTLQVFIVLAILGILLSVFFLFFSIYLGIGFPTNLAPPNNPSGQTSCHSGVSLGWPGWPLGIDDIDGGPKSSMGPRPVIRIKISFLY